MIRPLVEFTDVKKFYVFYYFLLKTRILTYFISPPFFGHKTYESVNNSSTL